MESLVLAGLLIVVGLVCGLLITRARSSLLRVLIIIALLVIAIDFQFPQADGRLRLLVPVIAIGVWLLREHITTLVSVTALAFYASNFVLGERVGVRAESRTPAARNASLPPLFHLILDEHIGIDGMPFDVPDAADWKADLVDTYLRAGYRMYSRAYSPYNITVNAIPNLLNYARGGTHRQWIVRDSARSGSILAENAYFQWLRKTGYTIRVYQPDFFDLCAGPVEPDSCYTIPRNTITFLSKLGLGWQPRMLFILTYYVANNSQLYRRAWQVYGNTLRPLAASGGIALPPWYWSNSRINAAGAVALLDRMRSDIADSPSIRGTAFVSHLIHPHSPYLFEADCKARESVWERLEPIGQLQENSAGQRQHLYSYYLPQVQCLALQLRQFTEDVQRIAGQDAIIILHGDHGSRLGTTVPTPENALVLTATDFADSYSTFFAVRAPGIAAGIDTTVIATESLLRHLTTTGFSNASAPPDPAPSVFLFNESTLEMAPVALPAFWLTGDAAGLVSRR